MDNREQTVDMASTDSLLAQWERNALFIQNSKHNQLYSRDLITIISLASI